MEASERQANSVDPCRTVVITPRSSLYLSPVSEDHLSNMLKYGHGQGGVSSECLRITSLMITLAVTDHESPIVNPINTAILNIPERTIEYTAQSHNHTIT